jgi:hypothetical protein
MILLVRPYMLLFLVHQPENAHASEAWSEGKKKHGGYKEHTSGVLVGCVRADGVFRKK